MLTDWQQPRRVIHLSYGLTHYIDKYSPLHGKIFHQKIFFIVKLEINRNTLIRITLCHDMMVNGKRTWVLALKEHHFEEDSLEQVTRKWKY